MLCPPTYELKLLLAGFEIRHPISDPLLLNKKQRTTALHSPFTLIIIHHPSSRHAQFTIHHSPCCSTKSQSMLDNHHMHHANRRRRREDDEFFHEGNELAHKDVDVIVYHVTDDDTNTNTNTKSEESFPSSFPVYSCCAPHCHDTFHSILACDEHYNERHIFECNLCNCVLPNEYLLDLVSASARWVVSCCIMHRASSAAKGNVPFIICVSRFHHFYSKKLLSHVASQSTH